MASSNFQRYSWTAFYVTIGILIGIIFVSFFSYFEKFNAFLLLLWSFAYLVIGALGGFIFSVPKIISDNQSIQPQDPQKMNPGERKKVEENTNLTQISDWLTKILIGAGLVELKETPKFVLHVSKVMAQGIRKATDSLNIIDGATIICAAIILYFVTWGFISGYLVMKLVLTEQFANSENES